MTDTPTREPLVGLAERLREAALDLGDGVFFGHAHAVLEAATALEEQSRRVEELTEQCAKFAARENAMRDDLVLMGMARDRYREALRPFVDLGPQRGAWGVISKKLDGLSPLTVTVTKAQMLAALSALSPPDTVEKGEGGLSDWVAFGWGALAGAAVFDFLWRRLFRKVEALHRKELADARQSISSEAH